VGVAGLYSSVAVDASGTNTSGTISANALYMGVHVGFPFINEHSPFNWVASVKGSASFSVGANLLTSLTGDATLITTAFSHIHEKKPDGTIVRTVYLKKLAYTGSAGDNGKLTFASFKSASTTDHVEIHYFVSEVLGEVTFEGVTTVASPKTLESFIIISDWSYASSSNYLVLVSGVATGSLAVTATGSLSRSSVSSGEGENKVYAYFSDEAVMDGKTLKVIVTRKESTTSVVVDNSVVQGKLDLFYKGGVSAQIVESSFEKQPGSKKIVYDPTLGAGTAMQNGVSKVVFFAVAYILALLI